MMEVFLFCFISLRNQRWLGKPNASVIGDQQFGSLFCYELPFWLVRGEVTAMIRGRAHVPWAFDWALLCGVAKQERRSKKHSSDNWPQALIHQPGWLAWEWQKAVRSWGPPWPSWAAAALEQSLAFRWVYNAQCFKRNWSHLPTSITQEISHLPVSLWKTQERWTAVAPGQSSHCLCAGPWSSMVLSPHCAALDPHPSLVLFAGVHGLPLQCSLGAI